MARDSEATVVEAWWPVDLGDDEHQDACPPESSRETAGSSDRFDLSTQRATARRRIPLSARSGDRVLNIDADPPADMAEGSSPDLFGRVAIPVEVRLRRDLAPSEAQIDDMVAWLRTRRIPRVAGATPLPAPEPPPPQVLEPRIEVEPAGGPLWPLVAVSLGLATALLAAIIL